MKTYEIAVFTGDTCKPIQRILIPTLDFLQKFLERHSSKQLCSVIIRHYRDEDEENEPLLQTEVFFGTVELFAKQAFVVS
jgi:hypothetical protein